MWASHTAEGYSDIKRSEVSIRATTWKNLENILEKKPATKGCRRFPFRGNVWMGRSIEAASRLAVSKGWGRATGNYGYGVYSGEGYGVLESDGGDGCTTLNVRKIVYFNG